MIVFDLFCAAGHRFEAWFRDNAAYEEQREDESILCPSCGDYHIVKAPTPLFVAQSRSSRPQTPVGGDEPPAPVSPSAPPVPAEIGGMLRQLREHIEKSCDYVGDRFAEEARSIHYGEKDAHNIFGEASAEEAHALKEEGIEVQPLPWLVRRNS